MNSIKAYGSYYFSSGHCPLAVQLVEASPFARHEHDLTAVNHCHDFSELVIVTGGNGIQTIDGSDYPVAAGDIFLLQGFSSHAFRDREKVSLINVQFAPERLPLPQAFLRKIPGYNVMFQVEPRLRSPRNFKHRLHLDSSALKGIIDLAMRLRDELLTRSPGWETLSLGLLLELITTVSRHYSRINVGNQAALVRLGDIISRMEDDFASDWTLERLSRLANSSPNNFLRLFRAATGDSPIDHLIKLRLVHAAELLGSTDMNITEIAFKCGFSDPNYFSKRFRAHFGAAPRKYRDSQP